MVKKRNKSINEIIAEELKQKSKEKYDKEREDEYTKTKGQIIVST